MSSESYEPDRSVRWVEIVTYVGIGVVLLAAVFVFLVPRPLDRGAAGRVPRHMAPSINWNYAGYATSNYPAVQGSHDGVQNDFTVANGLFGKATKRSIRDITDGTSNTFMVGERDLSLNHGTIWMRSIDAGGAVEDGKALVGVCHESHPLNAHDDPHAFSSMHQGGAHFLMADGAVKFLAETINPKTYNHLAEKADGQIVGEF